MILTRPFVFDQQLWSPTHDAVFSDVDPKQRWRRMRLNCVATSFQNMAVTISASSDVVLFCFENTETEFVVIY